MKKYKIWHFSDTHNYHNELEIPEGIDIAIFSGDESNFKDQARNEKEARDFLEWYSKLKIKYKVMIAGNHSAAIATGLIKVNEEYPSIIYLENESIDIQGIKIWGSPYTPQFGTWYYMRPRNIMYEIWDMIPKDTDIIISHGPPRGILDLAYKGYDSNGNLTIEYCGCEDLLNKCLEIKPLLVLFGHIHQNGSNINMGYRTIGERQTIYSNGSVLEDGNFNIGPITNGNIFTIEK